MVLIGVTVLKLNISNSIQKDHIMLLTALVVSTTLMTTLSLQTVPAYASVVESLNTKENWYDKALAVNQDNVPALVQKGTDLVSQDKAEQAITWLNKALSVDPTNLMALISKGTALKELGQYPEAIILYDRVLAIDPHDTYAIGGKVDSLFATGKHVQAVAWIDKALELEPNNDQILEVKQNLQLELN